MSDEHMDADAESMWGALAKYGFLAKSCPAVLFWYKMPPGLHQHNSYYLCLPASLSLGCDRQHFPEHFLLKKNTMSSTLTLEYDGR